MKTLLKISAIISAFALIVYGSYSFYKKSVIENMIERENAVSTEWRKVFNESSKRLSLIDRLVKNTDSNQFDSLKIYISNNQKERINYSQGFNLRFAKLEHDVNQHLLVFLDSIKKESNFEAILKELDPYTINVTVSQYNAAVSSYNIYRGSLPQLFILRKSRFEMKEFFRLEYGVSNEDPIVKDKKLREWPESVDSTL